MKCPNCDMNVSEDAKFCLHCGKSIYNHGQKFCSNCGAELIPGTKFCGVCGMSLNPNNVVSDRVVNNNHNKVSNEDGSTPTVLGIVALVLYFIGAPLISSLFYGLSGNLKSSLSSLSSIAPLAGLVTMIYGRVKYPNNKFLKFVMWVILISILLGIVLFVLFFIWCWATCASIDTSGCS